MRQIEFTHTGHSAIFGNFRAGDLLRCGDAEAKHFVEDARCARYVEASPLPEPITSAPAPAAKRAKKA